MVKTEDTSIDEFSSFLDGFTDAGPIDWASIDVKPLGTQDHKPPVFDVKPLVSDVKPLVSDVKPLLLDIKPLLLDVKPLVLDVKPPVLDTKPRIVGVKPQVAGPSAPGPSGTQGLRASKAIMERIAKRLHDARTEVKMEVDLLEEASVAPVEPPSILRRYPGRLACSYAYHPLGPGAHGVYNLYKDGSNLPTGRNGFPRKVVLEEPRAVLTEERRISAAFYYMYLLGRIPDDIDAAPIERLEEHLDHLLTSSKTQAVGCQWRHPRPEIVAPEDIKQEPQLTDYEEEEGPEYGPPESPDSTTEEEEPQEVPPRRPEFPLYMRGRDRRRAVWRPREPQPPRRHPRRHPLARKLSEQEAEVRRLRRRLDDREDTLHRVRREREELRHRVTRLYAALGEAPRAVTPFREAYRGRREATPPRENRRAERRRGKKVAFSSSVVIIAGLQGGDMSSPGCGVEDADY